LRSTLWETDPVILRVRTEALLRENPAPLFCRFNSGAPRCSNGKKSPRGPDTFLPADQFTGTCGDVVELTFLHGVALPACSNYRDVPSEPWRKLLE
jgi:hypothetical protein